jgi:GNAT superfamily N-acetyltransferase
MTTTEPVAIEVRLAAFSDLRSHTSMMRAHAEERPCVAESSHYAGVRLCQHDLLYLAPVWRGAGVGRRLIEGMRREARVRGPHRLQVILAATVKPLS